MDPSIDRTILKENILTFNFVVLDHGGDDIIPARHGSSAFLKPITAAARQGHLAIVELLLDRQCESWRRSGVRAVLHDPIVGAAKYGHEAIVRHLLNRSISVHDDATTIHDAIMAAANNGHDAVIRLLLEASNAVGGDSLDAAMFAAAGAGHEGVTRLLLERGVSVDIRNKRGLHTPLMVAAEGGHLALTAYLLQKGAATDARSRTQQTPLHCAAENGHTAVTALLLENGADIESKKQFGETPFMLAVESGHETLIKYLLAAGAYIDPVKDVFRRFTPLANTVDCQNVALTKLLLENGADIKHLGAEYRLDPAVQAAMGEGHEAVANALVHVAYLKGIDEQDQAKSFVIVR